MFCALGPNTWVDIRWSNGNQELEVEHEESEKNQPRKALSKMWHWTQAFCKFWIKIICCNIGPKEMFVTAFLYTIPGKYFDIARNKIDLADHNAETI